MIEQNIHSLMVADARFTDIALDRFRPVLLAENSCLPAATYQVISKRFVYALDGRVDITFVRMQVDTWANTYAAAKNLAEAITAILDDYSGGFQDGSQIRSVQIMSSTDFYDKDAHIYRVMTEFYIEFAQG